MEASEHINRISPQELVKRMEGNEDFVLIDTLTNDHFKKIHISGARNACVFEVVFLDNMGNIVTDKSLEIVVYGSSDKTMDAHTAAEKLLRAGYQNVSTLEGGIQQWAELGYAVEGDETSISLKPTLTPPTEDKTYTVDTEESVIEWAGRNPNTKHYGTIGLSKGELIVRDGAVTGYFEIDMKSIKNMNLEGDPLQPVLISHLLSDDFFFVEKFPTATFTLDEVKIIGDQISSPNVDVKGLFELRGIRRHLEFNAIVVPLDDCGITAEAHFDFDRTKWNVIYGSSRFFEHLGMHLVFDLISIQLKIVAR